MERNHFLTFSSTDTFVWKCSSLNQYPTFLGVNQDISIPLERKKKDIPMFMGCAAVLLLTRKKIITKLNLVDTAEPARNK